IRDFHVTGVQTCALPIFRRALPMSRHSRVVRTTAALLLGFTAVATLGGCKMFKKGPRGDYALAQEQRPLEVPPDLNLPDTSGAKIGRASCRERGAVVVGG